MPEKVEGTQGNLPGSGEGTQSTSDISEMPEWAKQFTADIQKQVAEIAGQQRALQGNKDKRFDQIQNELAEAQSTFEQAFGYAKKFQDPQEAERAWFIDQQIAASKRQGTPGSESQGFPGGTEDQAIPGNVDPSLLQAYGVDPASAEYLNYIRQGKSGIEAALAIVSKREARNPEGSATGASGGAGGTTTSQTTQQQVLKDQYIAELDAAAKLTNGVLKPNDLYRIQVKYAGLGLANVL